MLGSMFYCCQIRGRWRTADSHQMAPFYTRQMWSGNIFGTLPINILGFTHDIPEASFRGQWSGVENMRTTFTLDDVDHIHSTLLLFRSFPWRLCLCHCLCDCLCLCVRIFVRVWWADVMSFQKMYGLRGPSGLNMVNQAFIIVIAYRPRRRRRRRRKNQG